MGAFYIFENFLKNFQSEANIRGVPFGTKNEGEKNNFIFLLMEREGGDLLWENLLPIRN